MDGFGLLLLTAARLHFNCSGAHRMGKQWMPCAQHSDTHPASCHSH
jgi:hypothetical protein